MTGLKDNKTVRSIFCFTLFVNNSNTDKSLNRYKKRNEQESNQIWLSSVQLLKSEQIAIRSVDLRLRYKSDTPWLVRD